MHQLFLYYLSVFMCVQLLQVGDCCSCSWYEWNPKQKNLPNVCVDWLNVDAVCRICNVSENASFNVIKVR